MTRRKAGRSRAPRWTPLLAPSPRRDCSTWPTSPDGVRARAYRDFALTTLGTLSEKYLGGLTPGFEGILNGGVYHIHKNLGVHEAVMFGEYFFVEALDKALKALRRRATPQRVKPYPEDSLPAWARQWQDGPTEEDMPAPQVSGVRCQVSGVKC